MSEAKSTVTKSALIGFSVLCYIPLIVLLWLSGFKFDQRIVNLYLVEFAVPVVVIPLFWRRFYATSIFTVIGLYMLLWAGFLGGIVIIGAFLVGLLLDAIAFSIRKVKGRIKSGHQ